MKRGKVQKKKQENETSQKWVTEENEFEAVKKDDSQKLSLGDLFESLDKSKMETTELGKRSHTKANK